MSISKLSDIDEKLTGSLPYTFKCSYEKEITYELPKTIHFLWIFSSIPQKYIDNVKRCKKLNEDYTIYLWIDRDTPPIEGIEFKSISSLDLITGNLSESEKNISKGSVVDILRYEFIYKYGGIYSDIDAIFLKPFDHLFSKSFVSQELNKWGNITNSIFGFPKESKFLKFILDAVIENIQTFNPSAIPLRTGPTFFTTCYKQFKDDNILAIPQDYTCIHSVFSYSYQTFDGNWV